MSLARIFTQATLTPQNEQHASFSHHAKVAISSANCCVSITSVVRKKYYFITFIYSRPVFVFLRESGRLVATAKSIGCRGRPFLQS